MSTNFVLMLWMVVIMCLLVLWCFMSWVNWFNDEIDVKLGVLEYEYDWIIHDEIDRVV